MAKSMQEHMRSRETEQRPKEQARPAVALHHAERRTIPTTNYCQHRYLYSDILRSKICVICATPEPQTNDRDTKEKPPITLDRTAENG